MWLIISESWILMEHFYGIMIFHVIFHGDCSRVAEKLIFELEVNDDMMAI
jgi:hypothetical protein